ncbi:MAG: hypothetical protein EON60_01030 [Alphaproteobacteria bacterium]|nr:MAG: hypothetical protein EON60_01030 [Alphaproteobacteria bacterium]
MKQDMQDMAFIQADGKQIPAAKVLDVGDIRFVSEVDDGGPRARVFTLTYGLDGLALTADFVDDNHTMRGRLEGIHDDVMKKVRAAN